MWPAVGTFRLFLRSQELHSLTPLTSQRTASQRRAGRRGSSGPCLPAAGVRAGIRRFAVREVHVGAASSCQFYPRGFQDGHRYVGEEGGGEVRSPRVLMKRPPRALARPWPCVCVGWGDVPEGS